MKKKKPAVKIIDKVDISTLEDITKHADSSVNEVSIINKLQFVPGKLRVKFMEEVWRILTPGGKASIVVPYWSHPGAIQDPSTEWPPWVDQSFLYFNKAQRTAAGLPEIKCDFDFSFGYTLNDPEIMGKNTETQSFYVKHYLNSAAFLQVTLTKRV
jgi:SAM-dependent methyltransferase